MVPPWAGHPTHRPDMKMACHDHHQPQLTRLSQLVPPATHYTQLTNQWNEPPVADFAFSAPFQCFTPDSALHLKRICYTYYHTNHEYTTARTSACLRGVPEIEQAIFSCKASLEEMATRLVVLSARVVDGGGGSLAGCCLDAMVEVVDALVGEARHPSCRHLVGVLVLLVLDTRRPSRLAIISPSFDGGAGLAEAEPAANHTPEHGQTLP